MTVGAKLVLAVSAVDWRGNIDSFAAEPELKDRIAKANQRIALWSKQLENADTGNLALTFTREAQIQGHYTAALIALGLYKPASSAMRAMVESALYYTYFRTHPAELQTLVRDPGYFLDKRAIVEFHRKHSPDFPKKQDSLGLLSRLDSWYSEISGIVHGQVPGKWTTHRKLQDISFAQSICREAVSAFEHGEEIVHRLLLCTIEKNLWYSFTTTSKKQLLKGLSPTVKEALDLSPN